MSRLYTYSGFLGTATPEARSSVGPDTLCGIDPTAQLFSRYGMSYRNGGTGELIAFGFDPTNRNNTPAVLVTYHRVYIRIHIRPGAAEPIFLTDSANGAAFDLLHLNLTVAGQLDLQCWNGAAYASLGLSGVLTLEQVYRLEIKMQFNAGVSPTHDTVTAEGRLDGGTFAVGTTDVGDLVNSGTRTCTWGYAGAGGQTPYSLDLTQLACDDTTWIGATQFTQLALTGQGVYDEWVVDPNRDVRGILAFPDPHLGAFAASGSYASNLAGQRVSFTLESMAGRGITGAINSFLVAVMCPTVGSTPVQVIVRRNGVDTVQSLPVPTPGFAACYLFVNVAGWLPSDAIEIGINNITGGLTRMTAITAVVEHSTAADVSAGSAVRVLTGTYFGTALYQTVDLGALDAAVVAQRPDLVFIQPASVSGAPGAWWWDGMRSAHPDWSNGRIRSDGIFASPGKFFIGCPDVSVNAVGVKYAWVALFDPQRRVTQRGAVQLQAATDNWNVPLKDAAFTPEGLLIAQATPGVNTNGNMYYRGAGMAGDQSAQLDAATVVLADAVQSLGLGTFQVGTLCANNAIGCEYCAFRTSGFIATHLIAIGSYVGDNAGARVIPVTLDGGVPACTWVVPTNAVARHIRMGGRCATFGGVVAATAITGEAVNQFSVGITLNAAGVTYSYLVLSGGVDVAPPVVNHGCVDTFAPVAAAGGHGCLVNF